MSSEENARLLLPVRSSLHRGNYVFLLEIIGEGRVLCFGAVASLTGNVRPARGEAAYLLLKPLCLRVYCKFQQAVKLLLCTRFCSWSLKVPPDKKGDERYCLALLPVQTDVLTDCVRFDHSTISLDHGS